MCILYNNFWLFCHFYGSLDWKIFPPSLVPPPSASLYYQVCCIINITWFILQPVKAKCGRNQRSGVDFKYRNTSNFWQNVIPENLNIIFKKTLVSLSHALLYSLAY